LTFPIVLYSDLPQNLFGWTAPSFIGSTYLPFALSSIVFFYGGWIFLAGSWRELRAKLPGMMTLIAIAITVAYFYSVFTTFTGQGHTLFWELATLITIMLLGHWIEMKAVTGAQSALKELSKLLPDTAEVIRNGKIEKIALEQLKVGDIVLARPGGKISADGIVTEGNSEVDESIVTGESKPVKKQNGSEVIAGTINGDGSLQIRVTKIGENTFLAGVMRLVDEAQASKSKLQMLSDKAAFYLTIIAITTGIITFVAWFYFKSDFSFALERFVAVVVIACPHALGLAIPLVASISTTLAARNGFLVRRRLALEMARKIDVVLFDKTGTLTKGGYGVDKIISAQDKFDENDVLQFAASVDAPSEHFVAKAIVKAANERGLHLFDVKNFERIPGKGAKGKIAAKNIIIGGETILKEIKISIPENLKNKTNDFAKQGKTIVYVLSDSTLMGIISLADIIREESVEAVASLKKMGIKSAMVTGDSEDVAKWVASDLGIDEFFANVLPGQKSEKVRTLQERGLKVAMVGDGVNDAPALTQADLGIAIGAGTNVAIESAGIILMRNDPRDIPKIIKLSKKTYSKMIQNLFWATGYNVVALPLAAGVLAAQGILLQPAVSAILMSLSTVIVAVNATFLRRLKL
jgi:Cu2+-exporting ATPase